MNDIIKKFNEISIDFLTQTTNLVGKTYLYKYPTFFIIIWVNTQIFNYRIY